MKIDKEVEQDLVHEQKPKLHSLLIETAANGFICYENDNWRRQGRHPAEAHEPVRQVFNTKEQLTNFINDNFQ